MLNTEVEIQRDSYSTVYHLRGFIYLSQRVIVFLLSPCPVQILQQQMLLYNLSTGKIYLACENCLALFLYISFQEKQCSPKFTPIAYILEHMLNDCITKLCGEAVKITAHMPNILDIQTIEVHISVYSLLHTHFGAQFHGNPRMNGKNILVEHFYLSQATFYKSVEVTKT